MKPNYQNWVPKKMVVGLFAGAGAALLLFVLFGVVHTEISGDGIELIAEDPVLLRAGMGGLYVRTTGKTGKATLTLSAEGCESVRIAFKVSKS